MKVWSDQEIKDGVRDVFHTLFRDQYHTELVEGDGEPLYQPGSMNGTRHQIIFANGFWSSAFHEIAHWCVAGAERRKLLDYGYWYQPDGRDQVTQDAFQKVEVLPQSYEWFFTSCVGRPFYLSIDNLTGGNGECPEGFKNELRAKALFLLAHKLPSRCDRFVEGLQQKFGSYNHFQTYWARVRQGLELPQ